MLVGLGILGALLLVVGLWLMLVGHWILGLFLIVLALCGGFGGYGYRSRRPPL